MIQEACARGLGSESLSFSLLIGHLKVPEGLVLHRKLHLLWAMQSAHLRNKFIVSYKFHSKGGKKENKKGKGKEICSILLICFFAEIILQCVLRGHGIKKQFLI